MEDRTSRLVRRQQARERLIEAATTLLEHRAWPSITIDDLAAEAGLSRTAYYQHFTDREHLLITILQSLEIQLHQVASVWMRSGADPTTEHSAGLTALTEVFRRHGRVLQAASHTAPLDAEVGRAWDQLTAGIVAATTVAIRRDIAAGVSSVEDADAHQMSVALSALTRTYLITAFGRHPFADTEDVARILTTIWTKSLY